MTAELEELKAMRKKSSEALQAEIDALENESKDIEDKLAALASAGHRSERLEREWVALLGKITRIHHELHMRTTRPSAAGVRD